MISLNRFALIGAVFGSSLVDVVVPLEDIGELGYCARGFFVSNIGPTSRSRCFQINPGTIGIACTDSDVIDLRTVELYTENSDPIQISGPRIGWTRSNHPDGTLGVYFSDSIARPTGGSLMLLPGRMILSPSNPSTYCTEGSFATVRVNQAVMGIMGHISLLSPVDYSPIRLGQSSMPNVGPVSQFGTIGLQFGERIRVGYDVYSVIDRKYRELTGDDLDTHGLGRTLCGPILDRMPLIKFSAQSDLPSNPHGNAVNIILLPQDYIRVDPARGVCHSLIEPESDRYRPLTLNMDLSIHMVKHLGILFDYTTGRIAFCDPI